MCPNTDRDATAQGPRPALQALQFQDFCPFESPCETESHKPWYRVSQFLGTCVVMPLHARQTSGVCEGGSGLGRSLGLFVGETPQETSLAKWPPFPFWSLGRICCLTSGGNWGGWSACNPGLPPDPKETEVGWGWGLLGRRGSVCVCVYTYVCIREDAAGYLNPYCSDISNARSRH